MASNRIRVDLNGHASISQRILGTFFRRYGRRLEDAIAEGSEEGTRDVLDEWKRESTDLAPLEKGTLRRSIKTGLTERNGKISGEISASVIETRGGRRFDYAAYLHDIYPVKYGEKFKDPTTSGTIPRFIDKPLEDNAGRWAADIERQIEATLTRKGFRPRRR